MRQLLAVAVVVVVAGCAAKTTPSGAAAQDQWGADAPAEALHLVAQLQGGEWAATSLPRSAHNGGYLEVSVETTAAPSWEPGWLMLSLPFASGDAEVAVFRDTASNLSGTYRLPVEANARWFFAASTIPATVTIGDPDNDASNATPFSHNGTMEWSISVGRSPGIVDHHAAEFEHDEHGAELLTYAFTTLSSASVRASKVTYEHSGGHQVEASATAVDPVPEDMELVRRYDRGLEPVAFSRCEPPGDAHATLSYAAVAGVYTILYAQFGPTLSEVTGGTPCGAP